MQVTVLSTPIFTSSGNFATWFNLSSNQTYQFNYYYSSGNPWGSSYPSYTVTTLSNVIPLENNKDIYLFMEATVNIHAHTSYVSLPSNIIHGQTIRFLDVNSAFQYCNLQINQSNSNTINFSTSDTLNQTKKSTQYIYINQNRTSTNGNFLTL